jgi:hypothetical protein
MAAGKNASNEINVYGHVRGLGTLAVDHRVRLNIIPL